MQSGRWVFGAEGEVTGSTAKVTNNPSAAGALGFGRVKAGRDLYAGARIGYAVAPRTLIYAKGGYTNQRLDLVASNGTTETGQHYNLDGWRAGAGLEQSLGRKTYAKVEYRYSNYGKARLEYPSGGNTNNFSVDTDRHQVVAGVGCPLLTRKSGEKLWETGVGALAPAPFLVKERRRRIAPGF